MLKPNMGDRMDKDRLVEIFGDANEAIATLPQHLQEKGFELAVNLLAGDSSLPRVAVTPALPAPVSYQARAVATDGVPDVSDLLKVCRQNPERYAVFLKDAEDRGEPATVENLRQAFRTYRQDVPKLPNRDLDKLVANGWVEKVRNTSPLTFILKLKGRQQLERLIAAAAEG